MKIVFCLYLNRRRGAGRINNMLTLFYYVNICFLKRYNVCHLHWWRLNCFELSNHLLARLTKLRRILDVKIGLMNHFITHSGNPTQLTH